MHGLTPEEEIDYWRERARRAEAEVAELLAAKRSGIVMSDPAIARAREALKTQPYLVDLDDENDPYPSDVVGLFARAFVAMDKEADDMGRYAIECHVEYKQRRNEQFAAYERQRWATVAYLLDRAEQYSNGSGYRALFDELVGDIAEWRHVQCAEAGEYDDMRKRVDRILTRKEPK